LAVAHFMLPQSDPPFVAGHWNVRSNLTEDTCPFIVIENPDGEQSPLSSSVCLDHSPPIATEGACCLAFITIVPSVEKCSFMCFRRVACGSG